MRIEKFATSAGLSRKEFKKAIISGRVLVNGEKVSAGYQTKEEDVITLDGKKIDYNEFIYIMMNKPAGVVSATFDPRQKTVIDLLPEEYKKYEPFPVGRLDIDTEGLLILTNDGQTAHNLLSPKKKVYKKYYAEVINKLSHDDIRAFADGIILDDGYKTKPAKLEILEDEKSAYVYIVEGKFHQVKRMFADRENKVIYLKRVEFAKILLDESLEIGQIRQLTQEEKDTLCNLSKNKK